mgnify:CR=1 FL=1|jgi:hypothetical protein
MDEYDMVFWFALFILFMIVIFKFPAVVGY